MKPTSPRAAQEAKQISGADLCRFGQPGCKGTGAGREQNFRSTRKKSPERLSADGARLRNACQRRGE